MQTLFIILLVVLLGACSGKSPADQCLDSFRMELKDPESGKVLAFDEGTLTYSATNAYGARVQGKAICSKEGEVWARDRTEERIQISKRATQMVTEYGECLKKALEAGKSENPCGDLGIQNGDGEVKRKATEELGFD